MDFTISKKIDGKYVTLAGVKEGWKFSITPAGKKELNNWLNNGQEDYFNGNFKVWSAKEATAHDQTKQDGYQPPSPIEEGNIPF